MKSHKKILIGLALAGMLAGCNKALDLPTDGRITMDEVFSDYNRTRGYLNSCYGHAPAPYMDRSSFTDEAQDADDVTPGSRYINWYGGNITTSSFPANSVDGSPWNQLFEGIRKCNVFLENIQTATAYVGEEEKNGWIAQARTLRALYYLQLIKRYGDVPIFDKPLPIGHDFSTDKKSKFSDVVRFILNDCDEALKIPDSRNGFSWNVYENQFGIMTRAIAYAIKSQAVTYAASPLYSDGTITWADATKINAEALAQCLAHDYKLFDIEPEPDIAQNPYALYFFTTSNDQRSRDKETIYQLGGKMQVWRYAGLPTNPGMERTGPSPTQELVDSYEMANGEPAILGYQDAERLIPIINPKSGYDPNNPYTGRDPRFYASIYYNGSPRNLGSASSSSVNLTINDGGNQVDMTKNPDFVQIKTTGGDPYVMIPLPAALKKLSTINLTFEYRTNSAINNLQMFFANPLSEARSLRPGNLDASTEWKTYTLDIAGAVGQFNWGAKDDFIRFDIGSSAGATLDIRNIKIAESSTGVPVATYVGGAEGISTTDRRHTRTGYYMRKFNNHKSGRNNDSDGAIRLFRLGELYLNFAESAYQSAGPDAKVNESGLSMSAREALNIVRARAKMPALPAGLSKDDFEKRYRNERRIELAFEEHRYFDVRRWKILNQTDKFVTGMRITNNSGVFSYARFKFKDRDCSDDKFLLYPIDQNEVNKIFQLTGENWQNPGWLD